MSINLYDKLRSAFGSPIVDATEVEIDRASLSTVQGDDAQDMANELERLFGIVRQIQNDRSNENRPLNTFSGTTTVDGTNIGDFVNRNSLYVRSDDARVTFTLPTDAVLTTANQFPALIELSHFGGTARFDSGISPTNTVVIQPPTGEQLRRDSSTGTLLRFAELHRGDTAVITKQDASSPWVIVESSTDPRSSILPDGVFTLNSRTVSFPTNINGDHIVGGLSLYTPNQGDAFEATGSIALGSTFGRAIDAGDVIVAKIDDPSLVLDENNDDWLIIRDAGHGQLTLSEIRFLNQITEVDTFTYGRLISQPNVSAARIWLTPFILDHAPFINPSTDPNNPQSGESSEYIGGDETQRNSVGFDPTQDQMNDLTGTAGGTIAPASMLYIDIDGGFNINDNINDIFVEYRGTDGNVINRYSLANDFRPIVLTGSSDTYYVYDDVGANDNFSSINYHLGQTLDLVLRETHRQFNLNDMINLLPAIEDGSIDISKLDVNTQALIRSTTGISAVQEAKIAGLELTTSNDPIPLHTEFYQKIDTASSTNDLSHYVRIEQLNGIIPDYERTTDVFLLVPKNINLTGLQKVEDTNSKVSTTSVGQISTTDGRDWIGYTATLPAITGANSVLDNAWQLDGTLQNSELSGAQDSFKVHVGNLAQDVLDRINGGSGGTTPSTYTLPSNLEALSHDLTVNTRTETGWRALPSPIRATLTRQFAGLWDENRRTFTGNYFDDLTPGIDVVGFTPNEIFYYNDPNDSLNRSFPGAQSYILNDNIRFRNTSPNTTPITSNYNKVIGFDYALERPLGSGDNATMVILGSGNTPLMALSEQEGLYLNIGRGDGGQVSRTITNQLQVHGSQWSTAVGQTTNEEAEVIIPDSLTGSLTLTISIHLDDNGNDEGTHTETVTITNVTSDQNLGQRTFNFSGFPSVIVNITYDAVNNDLSSARRVLFLRPTQPFNNAALTYQVEASYDTTETWNHPTTYARYPINAGDGHDDFGLFDPHRYNTEHVEERNRVLFVVEKWEDGDQSTDPELALRVVVDGELESSGNKIRLHRPMSEFDFNDISFGNNICAVAHVQCYDYTASLPLSGSELLTLYGAGDRWLGAFTNDDFRTDAFVFNADIELAQGEFFVLRSADGSRYRISIENDGAVTTTKLI